jgi:hypothetical protein
LKIGIEHTSPRFRYHKRVPRWWGPLNNMSLGKMRTRPKQFSFLSMADFVLPIGQGRRVGVTFDFLVDLQGLTLLYSRALGVCTGLGYPKHDRGTVFLRCPHVRGSRHALQATSSISPVLKLPSSKPTATIGNGYPGHKLTNRSPEHNCQLVLDWLVKMAPDAEDPVVRNPCQLHDVARRPRLYAEET